MNSWGPWVFRWPRRRRWQGPDRPISLGRRV